MPKNVHSYDNKHSLFVQNFQCFFFKKVREPRNGSPLISLKSNNLEECTHAPYKSSNLKCILCKRTQSRFRIQRIFLFPNKSSALQKLLLTSFFKLNLSMILFNHSEKLLTTCMVKYSDSYILISNYTYFLVCFQIISHLSLLSD